MPQFFVRVGALAEVYAADSVASMPTGRRVIVRTHRGLELGQIVGASVTSSDCRAALSDSRAQLAKIVRPTTEQDEMLIRRLERHKRRAVEACREALQSAGSAATLLDVDQVFDGGTLIMHFLGPVDATAESITSTIAAEYESVVRSRHLAKLVSEGCGPECGTKEGGGCGTSCSGCAAAAACKTTKEVNELDATK